MTGFLGSGKTTLLNHLIQQPAFHNTLIIINEFGKVSLDHLLVTHCNEDMVVTMENGCVCCNIRRDLSTALKQITWRFSRNGIRQFNRVVIETTGLADPAPIVHTLMTDEFISAHYNLDAIITTVDCVNGMKTLAMHPEAVKQAAIADCLILTKSDLDNTSQYTALSRHLASLNPTARQLPVINGVIDSHELLDRQFFSINQKSPDISTWIGSGTYKNTNLSEQLHYKPVSSTKTQTRPRKTTIQHTSSNTAPSEHHNIQAFCLTFSEPLEPELFDQWLGLLVGLKGENLLRVKGILNLKHRLGPTIIHGVQHIFHPPVELTTWPSKDHNTRIVFITREIDPLVIERTFNAFASKDSTVS